MKQENYLQYVADVNFDKFFDQGFATAGHNGPHGHKDTPVRNTAHYLIIYTYLYKKTKDERYREISHKFASYLYKKQSESKSGAIQCMETDRFDHLNGLIGQGWVIEGLLYYYEEFRDENALKVAEKIFAVQQYSFEEHLWHRIELDGSDIGIDLTYNHQVWFAACASQLLDYVKDPTIEKKIRDFLDNGAKRDFRVYPDGLLKHYVNVSNKAMRKNKVKGMVKVILTPVKSISPKKFDSKYMEHAYHIFDMFGFAILKEQFGDAALYTSDNYRKAVDYARNIHKFNENCGVYQAIEKGDMFNIFSYSYNSPAFEYPYVAYENGFYSEETADELYGLQEQLMLNKQTKMFTRNNSDIDTWNARVYEIVRFLDNAEKRNIQ